MLNLRKAKLIIIAVLVTLLLALALAAPASANEDIFLGDGLWFCFEDMTYPDYRDWNTTTA